jgi:hypothetical protein
MAPTISEDYCWNCNNRVVQVPTVYFEALEGGASVCQPCLIRACQAFGLTVADTHGNVVMLEE